MAGRKYKLGFVGAGNMAEAICRAVLGNNISSADELTAYDVAEPRRTLFSRKFGVELSSDNASVVHQSRTVLLAVKPQQIGDVLKEVRSAITANHLIISVAAGISTAYIENSLEKPVPVVRVMPNTPLLVGCGMTALCKGRYATDEHLELASEIFGSAGIAMITEEDKMDAVTAISGSGPAYFFYLIEAMIEAGAALGLSPRDTLTLAAQTCLGAGKMILQTQLDPTELRRRVTSPGGTTEAALRIIEAKSTKGIIVEAIKAAAEKSKQLGR